MTHDAATFEPRRRRPHAVWFALVLALYLVGIVGAWQTEPTPGVCSGIGWGCELSGSDAAAFVAIIYALPGIGIMLAGHAVIAIVQRLRRRLA